MKKSKQVSNLYQQAEMFKFFRQEPPRDHRSPRFIRTSTFSVACVILFQCTSVTLSRHRRSGQQAFLPSSWLYNHISVVLLKTLKGNPVMYE